jgi:DNA-binding NarL/FixJ family response regulator
MNGSDSGVNGSPAGGRRRIMIVDDHPLVRQGLAAVINRQPDLFVEWEASTAAEALAILEANRPDLIVVDIVLNETNGVELIKTIHVLDGNLRMLALSMHDESLFAERVMRAGARGFVMKQESVETLLQAIRKVADGNIWVAERINNTLLREMFENRQNQAGPVKTGLASLSDRELEIYELIGLGLSTKDIARRLHLGNKTVETHRAGIKIKLKFKTALELVRNATLWVAGGKRI